MLVALAGLIETCQSDPWAWTHEQDHIDAAIWAHDLDPDDPTRAYAATAHVVRHILSWKRTRRAIAALARELVRRGTLDEDTVDRIIAEAFAASVMRHDTVLSQNRVAGDATTGY